MSKNDRGVVINYWACRCVDYVPRLFASLVLYPYCGTGVAQSRVA